MTKVYVSEERVPEAVPAEVAGVFAALKGGLCEAVESFRSRAEHSAHALRDERRRQEERIEALEEVAASLIVGCVRGQVRDAKALLERMEKKVDFERGQIGCLVLGFYGMPELNGHCWFRRNGGVVDIELTLSTKDHRGIDVHQLYGRASDFDTAYDRVMAERSEIEALLGAMMATAVASREGAEAVEG